MASSKASKSLYISGLILSATLMLQYCGPATNTTPAIVKDTSIGNVGTNWQPLITCAEDSKLRMNVSYDARRRQARAALWIQTNDMSPQVEKSTSTFENCQINHSKTEIVCSTYDSYWRPTVAAFQADNPEVTRNWHLNFSIQITTGESWHWPRTIPCTKIGVL